MTTDQKGRVQFGVNYAIERIQEIEAGSDDLCEKERRVNHQLLMMLDDVIFALPKTLREHAQACIDVRYRMHSAVLAETDFILNQHKKEAGPSCLQALDSL